LILAERAWAGSVSPIDIVISLAVYWNSSRQWLAIPGRCSMKNKLVVVVMFLAGVLGGATAARASSQQASQDEKTVSAVPCAVDMCIINGRCRICPE
jgi:hypothetical protein